MPYSRETYATMYTVYTWPCSQVLCMQIWCRCLRLLRFNNNCVTEVYTSVYINLSCSHLGLECGEELHTAVGAVHTSTWHVMYMIFIHVKFRISTGCLNCMHAIVHSEKKYAFCFAISG